MKWRILCERDNRFVLYFVGRYYGIMGPSWDRIPVPSRSFVEGRDRVPLQPVTQGHRIHSGPVRIHGTHTLTEFNFFTGWSRPVISNTGPLDTSGGLMTTPAFFRIFVQPEQAWLFPARAWCCYCI